MRLRRGPKPTDASAGTVSSDQASFAKRLQAAPSSHLDGLQEHGLLERVCELLSALDVARMLMVSHHFWAFGADSMPRFIEKRFRPGWQLQTAYASEVAVFFDYMRDTTRWMDGPNASKPYNVASTDTLPGDEGAWTFLKDGTDWLGFQGIYCQFSQKGCRPKWVSFRVCLHTLDLSGAFFALSAGKRTWGLQPIIFIFNYRGDDMQSGKRCFALQTLPNSGELHIMELEQEQIRAGVAYEVSIRLHWGTGTLALFINGQKVLEAVPFQADLQPQLVGLYNWRSQAVCAFSEVMIGNAPPYQLTKNALSVWRISEGHSRFSDRSRNRSKIGWIIALTSVLVLLMICVAWRAYSQTVLASSSLQT